MTSPISQINTKALYDYIQKQYENRRFAKYIEIGATFFIISFFLLFAVRPTVLVISALVGEIKSKELASTQMKAKIDKLIVAQDIFSQVQEKYALIESALPSRPNYSAIAKHVNGSLIESQLPTSQINFSFAKADSRQATLLPTSVSSYSISTSIKGNYPAILTAIDKLLNSRRLIDIKTITLSTSKDTSKDTETETNQGQVNASIAPVIYYWSSQTK